MFKNRYCVNQDILRYSLLHKQDELLPKLRNVKHLLSCDFLCVGITNGQSVASSLLLTNADSPCNAQLKQLNFHEIAGQEVLSSGFCVHRYSVTAASANVERCGIPLPATAMGIPLLNEIGENVGVVLAPFPVNTDEASHQAGLLTMFVDCLETFVQKNFLEKNATEYLSLVNEVEAMSKTGAWEYSLEADTVFWSDQVYRIYGVPRDTVINADMAIGFYKPEERPVLQQAFHELLSDGKPYDLELKFIDAKGVKKWVRTSGNCERDADGNVCRVFGAIEDTTVNKNLTLKDAEYTHKVESILNSIKDAVLTINCNGVIQHCNHAAATIFGYTQQQLLGSDIAMLMPSPYAVKHKEYMASYERTGEAKIIGVGRQLPAKRKSGEIFQMELSLSELYQGGEKYYIGVVRDISERIDAQDTIYNLAYTDNVTNLRNSQWFERKLKELSCDAVRYEHYIHVMLLDIDSMGAFNHRFGFNEGDNALKQIAQNIKRVIGDDYSLYKYDADSFIVLHERTIPKRKAKKINTGLIENALLNAGLYTVEVSDHYEKMSISLSSAIFDPTEHGLESMLSILESGMLKAKAKSPYGLCHIGKEGIAQYDKQARIKNLITGCIHNNELSLMYQPQYNNDGEIKGCEALLRWHSKELGWVSPAEFIPLAEESAVINSIGDWVLHQACFVIKDLMWLGVDCTLSVNISAKQIIAPDFAAKLVDMLYQYEIPPQLLMLELTETTLVTDMSAVRHVMSSLAKSGIAFSIDDFGTGYSSLAYLKELPISEIKIDKYFVDDITEDYPNTNYTIVDAIINIAKALNVHCIAEGVETQIQFDYLKRKGCSLYQGYLFSKPVDKHQWLASLNEHKTGFINK
ncbi:EAL and GGDEF domain-containing protein [Alteromonas sp. A081]|uniref:sensor domain-containing protein n=1 Tax=Alteromonas sp. A081 TaxID=3410269 RepID=UPI003B980014